MAKKSIGQFLAALRKANGMTQQEVADRLSVSNKAVSRWERDECAPDISLIPALSEMFSVTCDEILRGERIPKAEAPETPAPKVEKQLKALITGTLSTFKTKMWIALALSAAGILCMFGISYSLYHPLAGFYIMLLFEAAAFTVAITAVVRLRDKKQDNELLLNMDGSLLKRFNSTLGSLSYSAFFMMLAAVVLSVPLILNGDTVYSVINFDYYSRFLLLIAAVLMLVAAVTKKPYIAFVTAEPMAPFFTPKPSAVKRMSFIQIISLALASALLFASQYFQTDPTKPVSVIQTVLEYSGSALILLSIIVFIVYAIRYRKAGFPLFFTGIRNLLLIPAVIMLANSHQVFYTSTVENPTTAADWELMRYVVEELLWNAVAYVIIIFSAFALINGRMHENKREKKNQVDE